MAEEQHPPTLVRRLGTPQAVVLGLSAMLGAGVFAAFGPAAAAAGPALLVGLLVAAAVAYANATASAQLAAQMPTSGGTYVYGRELLGPWPGYVAGWSFVVGKTASCAAMALTVAAYAAPERWVRPVAAAVVVAVTAVAYRGVTRTAAVARVLLAVVLAGLALVVVAALGTTDPAWPPVTPGSWSPAGILQAAGLLFFAFAGYARLATLGEEVREPATTIPRAIRTSLAVALGVYAAVGVALLTVLGPERLAASAAPVAELAGEAGTAWVVVARVAATAAALGALLALVAGVSRTVLAMARERDLPSILAAVHPRFRVPHRAEVGVGALVLLLVLTIDLRGALGFSSFGVLTYYLVANLAALRQPAAFRRSPRWLAVLGAVGCVTLAFSLPVASVVAGAGVIAVGVAGRALRRTVGAPGGGPR